MNCKFYVGVRVGSSLASDNFSLVKTASADLGDIIGTLTIESLGGKRFATNTATSSSDIKVLII